MVLLFFFLKQREAKTFHSWWRPKNTTKQKTTALCIKQIKHRRWVNDEWGAARCVAVSWWHQQTSNNKRLLLWVWQTSSQEIRCSVINHKSTLSTLRQWHQDRRHERTWCANRCWQFVSKVATGQGDDATPDIQNPYAGKAEPKCFGADDLSSQDSSYLHGRALLLQLMKHHMICTLALS